MSPGSGVNILSVDLEDYFHAHNVSPYFDRSTWASLPSHLESNARFLLGTLRNFGCKATFFVLGWVADQYPGLVRDLHAQGHELATHGYAHELAYRQSPAEFAEDLKRSLLAIRRSVGDLALPIVSYRAPSFSITRANLHYCEILRDHGIRFDSSIVPVSFHDRYGIAGAHRFAFKMPSGVLEVPPSTFKLFGRNWPVGGGGYLRLYPLSLTKWAFRNINRAGRPAVVYVHPWEMDLDPPDLRGVPAIRRVRHGVGLKGDRAKLGGLLRSFRFDSIRSVFGDCARACP